MDSKRVFIIGAGFSKQVGMPLATEMTPLLRHQFEECDHKEALTWLAWLDERVNWMNSRAENGPHTPNIEELFDLAHFDALTWKMRQQMCPVGRGDGDTPYSTATSIEAWLRYMEDALGDVIWHKQEEALEELSLIDRFTTMLQGDDAVVTFNYDTLIEQSMSKAGRLWQYGFTLEKGTGTSILKMHGSINWAVVLRNQAGNFGYPVLFRKEDQNVGVANDKSTGEIEYDYALLRIPDDKLAPRIENRIIQLGNKQYGVGIAGLGRYKPLDQIPGTGEVWHNAGRALYKADEIYAIGFSLSPYDTMARLHFAGAMCERAKKNSLPQKITLIDPSGGSLEADYRAVFGRQTPLEVVQERAEEVDWAGLLSP
ncbi:hypothetical protein [Anaerobaca lacustris]|uniref:SIR2-like domain-containing protein n=1 Tax=Anaerobaca lacustris TaxID=3044600 RepID=A0AAW6TXU3_9BACT|nr:hypothetical protein [Sedimentisphaerales bacterium M17dextr]